MTDSLLLARTAAGDRDAFRTFVLRYRDSAWRYARLLGRTDADAEDVLQKTFVAAWRSASTFAGEHSARAWLMTIVRHASIRNGRLRAGQPTTQEGLDVLGAEAGFATDEDPELLLQRLEERAVLERALQSLALEDREVLVLRELEGLSGEEVAAALALSLPGMKSRLHRARLRLLAAVRKEMPDVG